MKAFGIYGSIVLDILSYSVVSGFAVLAVTCPLFIPKTV